MPTVHELLDETRRKCQALAQEIEVFKSARELHQKATESLDAACQALATTAAAIEPYTKIVGRMRRLTAVFLAGTALNFAMFAALLFLFLFEPSIPWLDQFKGANAFKSKPSTSERELRVAETTEPSLTPIFHQAPQTKAASAEL